MYCQVAGDVAVNLETAGIVLVMGVVGQQGIRALDAALYRDLPACKYSHRNPRQQSRSERGIFDRRFDQRFAEDIADNLPPEMAFCPAANEKKLLDGLSESLNDAHAVTNGKSNPFQDGSGKVMGVVLDADADKIAAQVRVPVGRAFAHRDGTASPVPPVVRRWQAGQ